MALVHDLAEAVVGDLTPECGIAPDDKHRLEQEAMDEIMTMLPSSSTYASIIRDLFNEYNEAKSAEAQLVKQVDKLEFLIQSGEYERQRGRPGDFEEFFKSTRHLVKEPFLVDVMVAVEEERVRRKSM